MMSLTGAGNRGTTTKEVEAIAEVTVITRVLG